MMNNMSNNFSNHHHNSFNFHPSSSTLPSSQPCSSSFYDSLLSLEKFIDKKHAFDDFAHLVFKAPLFEDLMAVVSVYTSAFGPMSDREVAMVQKRMYQLNRQTVRAMHEIINQKQLIAGINSKEVNPNKPLGNTFFGMSTTPLPMTPRSQPFGNPFDHHDHLPTTILNTPVHTPNADRFFGTNKSSNSSLSAGKMFDHNDRSAMTVQDLLRIQQNWAASMLSNAGSQRMNNDTLPTTPGSSIMDNSGASFLMSPPQPKQQQATSTASIQSMLFSSVGGVVLDDSGKIRNHMNPQKSTRRRNRSETALLDM